MQLFRKFKVGLFYFFSKKEIEPLLGESQHLKSFEDRALWVEKLVHWISWEKRPHKEFDTPELSPQASRLAFVIQVLEKKEPLKKAVGIQLWTFLSESSSQELFSEVGLVREGSVFSEFATRLWQKFLPPPVKGNDLTDVFDRCLGSDDAVVWIKTLPTQQIHYLQTLIRESAIKSETAFSGLSESVGEALLILGAKTASVGLSRQILDRLSEKRAHASVFMKFNRTAMAVAESLRMNRREEWPGLVNQMETSRAGCLLAIKEVLEHIESSGVSVPLVYDLECLQSWTRRATLMTRLSLQSEKDPALILGLLTELAEESVLKKSILQLIRENVHLLSRKIVERTGDTGEHYITRGFSDYLLMFYKAMGGGFVMAFTTVQKYFISIQHFPLFFQGFFTSLNYAGSFVLIHLLHMTIATKQPSMTAPNLAGKLEELSENADVFPFINEVARISRSQFISIVGNLAAVFPMALFIDKAYAFHFGHPIYTAEYASHSLHALHPFESGTILFAFLTGILLWISSVCAGGFENWVVFENIPQAMAGSRRLHGFLGKRGARALGQWFLRQSSGLAGNISLGFLLGFLPVIAAFFGLPLEVRHVTLSAGSLALSISQMLHAGTFNWELILWPSVGLLCVGFLNVTVSFLLALFVATRARNVRKGATLNILRAVFLTFLKKPRAFVFPPKSGE